MVRDLMDSPNPAWKTFICPVCGWVAEELSSAVWCPGTPEHRHRLRQMVLDEVSRARIRKEQAAARVRQHRTREKVLQAGETA